MKLWRAWATLLMLSFRRLLWSANTLMIGFPLVICAIFLWRLRYDLRSEFAAAFDDFSDEFVIFTFATFIVPICAIAYATTSVGGDREDRTLLFLLVRPIPRWLIFSAKLLATLPLVLGIVVSAFWLYCQMAGTVGQTAFTLYLPAVFYMTVAYVGLFHLFAVTFRHSTIVALLYALFIEAFVGNMPGIIKRATVSYYGRSIMYDVGAYEGLDIPDPTFFAPISAHTAGWTLLIAAAVSTILALLIFSSREFRDLT